MSTLKARFTAEQARALLAARYGEVGALVPLRGGEVSQAYAFTTPAGPLVLRVNHQVDYAADEWAWRTIGERGIPVPRVLATGREGRYHWAVSERVPGRTVQELSPAEVRALVLEMVAILLRIHDCDVGGMTGYGLAIATGARRYPTWRAYLEATELPGDPRDLIDWPRALADAPAEQRALIEGCWARGRALLRYCPDERALNHGDYNLGNILADGGRITGVVDWASAAYGDPLRDVAWVDFWWPQLRFGAAYLAARPLADALRRIRCYQLFIAARSLGFFLHTGQPEKGASIVPLATALLADPASPPAAH